MPSYQQIKLTNVAAQCSGVPVNSASSGSFKVSSLRSPRSGPGREHQFADSGSCRSQNPGNALAIPRAYRSTGGSSAAVQPFANAPDGADGGGRRPWTAIECRIQPACSSDSVSWIDGALLDTGRRCHGNRVKCAALLMRPVCRAVRIHHM